VEVLSHGDLKDKLANMKGGSESPKTEVELADLRTEEKKLQKAVYRAILDNGENSKVINYLIGSYFENAIVRKKLPHCTPLDGTCFHNQGLARRKILQSK